MAELRVDPGPRLVGSITRVTVEAAGVAQDLVLNPSGVFAGTILLPPGTQTVQARAFSGDTQVGISQPTAVEVTSGQVTRVILRIVDTSGVPQRFGPIFDSLVYPTSLEAGVSGTFALSIIAPAGDPVIYQWSSDCADSTFSAPQAATTSWSKPTPGSCEIDVVAISNGLSTTQSFRVAVFPQGATSGAVDVNGVFIDAPDVSLFFPAPFSCVASRFSNSSCPSTIVSPTTVSYDVSVSSWGLSTPGSIEVSDDCGGRSVTTGQSSDFAGGNWLPPTAGGLCRLTARVVNGDGGETRMTAAILVRPGTPATSAPPRIRLSFSNGSFFCSGDNAQPTAIDCGQVDRGVQVQLSTSMDWIDGLPFSVSMSDSCGGGDQTFHFSELFGAQHSWSTSNAPGRSCTLTVSATSLQGATSQLSATYQLR